MTDTVSFLLNTAAHVVEAEADRIMTVAHTTDPRLKKAMFTLAARIRALQPADEQIHLMWNDGHILCGIATAKRFWQNWTMNALNWHDLVCQSCVQVWTHPAATGEEC